MGPRTVRFVVLYKRKIACSAVNKTTINDKRGAYGNRDSDQAAGWITNVCGSIAGRRKILFDVQSVHKNSGTYRATIPAGIDDKRVAREVGHPVTIYCRG